jgi:long-chain acyl-CoA synthetase
VITRVANSTILRQGNRFARGLDAAGVAQRGGVAALLGNVPEFLFAYRGASWSGRIWTPICWHWKPDEVAYVVRDCEAQALFAHVEFAEAALAAADAVPPAARFSVGGSLPGFRAVEELAELSDAPLEQPVAGDTMLYTSGTTGRPKGVRRPPRAPQPPPGVVGQAGMAMLRRFTGDAARGPHLVAAPLYHAGPSTYCEGAVLLGEDIVLQGRWDAREFLRAVESERIVSTFLVPTHFVRLLRLAPEARAAHDLSTLRLVLHGSAPVAPPVKRQMIEWLGPVLFEFYGGTEGGGVGISSQEWLAHPGSVGRPAPGLEVHVLDADGKPCPPGVAGDVYFRGNPTFEYKGDPDQTAAGRRGDLVTIGDVGYLDAEGYLYLCDRRADVVISGGVNIYPAQVEAALLEHPAVADCCAVGVPDEEWGERLLAVVQPEPGRAPGPALSAELLAHCRARLAGYQVPRAIEFEARVERTETGKLARRAIRDRWRRRAAGAAPVHSALHASEGDSR